MKSQNLNNKILIITVNFGNPSNTIQLVESIPQRNDIVVWVEDNKFSNEASKMLFVEQEKTNREFSIFTNDNNYYYWGAFSKAVKRLPNDLNQRPKWIIICNNDITFSKDFFVELDNIDHHHHILAPSIISMTKNEDLNPFFYFPLSKLEKLYYAILYTNHSFSRVVQYIGSIANRFRKKLRSAPQNGDLIYAPHGSCMIFSEEFFHRGGFIDTGFKMFGEEISTAEIAKKIGAKIYYHPKLIAKHYDHQTTSSLSSKQLYDISKETFFYLKKTYSI